jgi:hypothetical protein
VAEDTTKYNPPGGPDNIPAEVQEPSDKQSLQCDQCNFTTKLLKPSKATQRLKSHINSQHMVRKVEISHNMRDMPCSVKGCVY